VSLGGRVEEGKGAGLKDKRESGWESGGGR
jgi:hypothetical protein